MWEAVAAAEEIMLADWLTLLDKHRTSISNRLTVARCCSLRKDTKEVMLPSFSQLCLPCLPLALSPSLSLTHSRCSGRERDTLLLFVSLCVCLRGFLFLCLSFHDEWATPCTGHRQLACVVRVRVRVSGLSVDRREERRMKCLYVLQTPAKREKETTRSCSLQQTDSSSQVSEWSRS